MVHRKTKKLPIRWSPTDSDAEVIYIIDKFRRAGYPLRFINNIVNDFIKSSNSLQDSYIIPANLFEKQKPLILT